MISIVPCFLFFFFLFSKGKKRYWGEAIAATDRFSYAKLYSIFYRNRIGSLSIYSSNSANEFDGWCRFIYSLRIHVKKIRL